MLSKLPKLLISSALSLTALEAFACSTSNEADSYVYVKDSKMVLHVDRFQVYEKNGRVQEDRSLEGRTPNGMRSRCMISQEARNLGLKITFETAQALCANNPAATGEIGNDVTPQQHKNFCRALGKDWQSLLNK